MISRAKARNTSRANPIERNVQKSWGIIGVLAIVAGGCGYHLAASGSGLPAQARTICVEKFTNRSRFNGLNDEFMRYLKDEIADHKRLELVDSPAAADLVLDGELVAISDTMPISANAVGEPTQYSETITASASLSDTHTHKVLWSSRGISGSQSYAAVSSSVVTTSPIFLRQNLRSQDIAQLPDAQLAQTQRSFSRGQMMEQLAQNLYASMSEGF